MFFLRVKVPAPDSGLVSKCQIYSLPGRWPTEMMFQHRPVIQTGWGSYLRMCWKDLSYYIKLGRRGPVGRSGKEIKVGSSGGAEDMDLCPSAGHTRGSVSTSHRVKTTSWQEPGGEGNNTWPCHLDVLHFELLSSSHCHSSKTALVSSCPFQLFFKKVF